MVPILLCVFSFSLSFVSSAFCSNHYVCLYTFFSSSSSFWMVLLSRALLSTRTRALCLHDSDQDGRTNGEELGDPCCTWFPGQIGGTALEEILEGWVPVRTILKVRYHGGRLRSCCFYFFPLRRNRQLLDSSCSYFSSHTATTTPPLDPSGNPQRLVRIFV